MDDVGSRAHGRVALGTRLRVPAALVGILPAVFAVAAALGMALTVASLAGTPAVDIGIFRSVGHDALSVYLGHGLYHDPAGSGYTGTLYTPLDPLLISLLDHLGVWNGWPVLVTVCATAVLGLLVVWVAQTSAGERRASTVVGALGLGGLAIWLVTSAAGYLYVGSTDELAWALALVGLVAGVRAHRSRGAAALTVVSLTLAFWSKQTTLVASLAFGLWLVALTFRGRRRVRCTAGLLGALAVLNLLVLGALLLATGGWEFYFNFTLPTRQANVFGLGTFLSDLVTVLAPPAVLALVMGAAALGRDGIARIRLDGVGGVLALFVVLDLPFALYFRSKQGGAVNQYFGILWALGLLVALAWGVGRRRAGTRYTDAVIGLVVVGALLATGLGAGRFDLRMLRSDYNVSIPAGLRRLARRGPLFHPLFTDLVPGQVYPDVANIADLLASGRQPMGLVRALLSRRFQYVVTYGAALGPGNRFQEYASGFGKYESNYFWKLDRVMAAGYRTAPGLFPGTLERRPGPNRAAELASCFSPFTLAHETWSIRRGGGFWCRTAPDVITLRDAPAAQSELITDESLRASGSLRLRADPGAEVQIGNGAGWSVQALRVGRGWVVARRSGGRAVLLSTRQRELQLDLGAGAGLPVGPDAVAGRISIVASPARGVRVDMAELRLRG